jgi:hypothetical protein
MMASKLLAVILFVKSLGNIDHAQGISPKEGIFFLNFSDFGLRTQRPFVLQSIKNRAERTGALRRVFVSPAVDCEACPWQASSRRCINVLIPEYPKTKAFSVNRIRHIKSVMQGVKYGTLKTF